MYYYSWSTNNCITELILRTIQMRKQRFREFIWPKHDYPCPTLCDPMDCSPPGSSIHGILQARVLEWIAISFSRGSSLPRDWTRVFLIAGRCFTICWGRSSKIRIQMLAGLNSHLEAWLGKDLILRTSGSWQGPLSFGCSIHGRCFF